MAREIELKLELPAAAADKVMRLPWLWEQAVGEIKPTTMVAKYYDTPNHDLRKSGISLRVRRIGKKHVQTVKSSLLRGAKPLARDEWERETASEEPQLSDVTGTPLAKMSKRRLKRELAPVFVVNVERSAYPIESANSAIEVAIDRGSVTTEHGTLPFCEIELELKRGSSSELARIGRRLANEAPVSLGLKSKADRGFELRRGGGNLVHYGAPAAIDKHMTVGEAFQAVAWGCLRHFSLNAEAVRNGNAEAIHQMRVGLRRMRAVISVFHSLFDGPETDRIKSELAWITNELGAVRDLDVLLTRLDRDRPGDGRLLEFLRERRTRAADQASMAVDSDRFRQAVLKTALWILAAEWSDAGGDAPAQPHADIRTFAARELTRLKKRLVRKLERIADYDAASRHKLRIDVKRLRYASDALVRLFPSRIKRRKRFDHTLRRLQDTLGRMNDLVVQSRIAADAVAAEGAAGAVLFSFGDFLGFERARGEDSEAVVRRLAKGLARAKPYWR